MGIQAFVKISDLEAAGAKVNPVFRPIPTWDESGEPSEPFILREAQVLLPTGKELWFHLSLNEREVWIDANDWGMNRITHLAPLEELCIYWEEA